jgi:hypothetical protein
MMEFVLPFGAGTTTKKEEQRRSMRMMRAMPGPTFVQSVLVDARANLLGWVVLAGGGGLLFGAMCVIVFGLGQRMWPVWLFWFASLALFVVACLDAARLRVCITPSQLIVRRAWGTRIVPLRDITGVRIVKAEYVVQVAGGSPVWIPMMVSSREEVAEVLRSAVVKNVVHGVLRDGLK